MVEVRGLLGHCAVMAAHRMRRFLAATLIIQSIFLAGGPVRAAEVTVFAAASLKTALDAAAAAWQVETGHRIRAVYAGSSGLARQIAQGAPAELFLSANVAWMDWLEEAGALVPGSRRDILGNRLVVIGAAGAPPVALADLAQVLAGGRLAMALVDAVPAGIYGRAALEYLGQWDALAPHVVETDNVRAALALVAVGAVPMGLVYATDAAAEPRVGVRAEISPDSHPKIVYPGALLRGASPPAAAFLDYLSGADAGDLFRRHGFEVLP